MSEFRMQGYMVAGELHVREADCRRAVNDALRTGKETLIASHDKLLEVLQLIQGFNFALDDSPHGKEIRRRAESVIADATRAG